MIDIVIFLDFQSTKQGLSVVDSWSRGLESMVYISFNIRLGSREITDQFPKLAPKAH